MTSDDRSTPDGIARIRVCEEREYEQWSSGAMRQRVMLADIRALLTLLDAERSDLAEETEARQQFERDLNAAEQQVASLSADLARQAGLEEFADLIRRTADRLAQSEARATALRAALHEKAIELRNKAAEFRERGKVAGDDYYGGGEEDACEIAHEALMTHAAYLAALAADALPVRGGPHQTRRRSGSDGTDPQ